MFAGFLLLWHWVGCVWIFVCLLEEEDGLINESNIWHIGAFERDLSDHPWPLLLGAQCTTCRNTENPRGCAPWTPALPGASRCAGPSVLGMGLPAAKGQISPDLATAVI